MKKLSLMLMTGLAITLAACGGTVVGQPEPEPAEVVEDVREDNEKEPETDPVADVDAPSEESLINDFKDLLFRFEGGMESDFSDTVTGEINGYEMEFYRVTEPGIGTLQELEDYLSERVDRDYVKDAMNGTEMYMESDGALYACPAGRGDDLSIGWVELAAETDGETGKVIVTIHRQDCYMVLGDWYEKDMMSLHLRPHLWKLQKEPGYPRTVQAGMRSFRTENSHIISKAKHSIQAVSLPQAQTAVHI